MFIQCVENQNSFFSKEALLFLTKLLVVAVFKDAMSVGFALWAFVLSIDNNK